MPVANAPTFPGDEEVTSSSWTTTAAIHHLARAKPTILVDFFVTNIGGAACFVQVHDSVNLPANGVKPRLRIKLPAEAGDIRFDSGCLTLLGLEQFILNKDVDR